MTAALSSPLLAEQLDSSSDGAKRAVKGYTEQQRGLIWMTSGVLLMVPDGTLIKLIHAPGDTTALWRLGLTSVTLALVQLMHYGSRFPSVIFGLGPWGVLVALLSGLNNVLFIVAMKHATVANVVLIIATGTFWAALLSRAVLGAEIRLRTWIAMPIVFAGVAVAVSAGLSGRDALANCGEFIALAVAVLGAVRRTIMRHHSGIDMLPAVVLGNLLFAILLLSTGTSTQLQPGDWLPVSLLGVVFVPAGISMTTIGSQMLPSAESCLIFCLETVLSPVMAAWVAGDQVIPQVWLGLAIVVVAVACHGAWPERQQQLGSATAREVVP